MKKFNVIVLVICTLCACASYESKLVDHDYEHELYTSPFNYGNVVSITPGSSYTASMLQGQKRHLYSFSFSGNHKLKAHTSTRTAPMNIRIINSSGNTVAQAAGIRSDSNYYRTEISFDVTPGTYTIELEGSPGWHGEYTLYLDLVSETPIEISNGSYSSAIQGEFKHFYSINVTSNSWLTVRESSTLNIYMRIYNSSGNQIANSNRTIEMNIAAGTYLIEIYCYQNRGGPYTLHVSYRDMVISAQEPYTSESVFNVLRNDDGNSVTITGYSGNEQFVNIPPTIRGLPVTRIGDRVFYQKRLINIRIPDTVITIGNEAFANNQLTNVTIPDSVTSISSTAFNNNQLTSITIGSGIRSLTGFANNQLRSINIPASVTAIGHNAFTNNQLTNVVIPESVTSIGGHAFSNNSLRSIIIPSSVTMIDISAFANNQLTSINIPNTVTTVRSGAFVDNPLTSIIIPDSVTSLEARTFYRSYSRLETIPRIRIVIGSNVRLSTDVFPLDFNTFYTRQGLKGGTYVYQGGAWGEDW